MKILFQIHLHHHNPISDNEDLPSEINDPNEYKKQYKNFKKKIKNKYRKNIDFKNDENNIEIEESFKQLLNKKRKLKNVEISEDNDNNNDENNSNSYDDKEEKKQSININLKNKYDKMDFKVKKHRMTIQKKEHSHGDLFMQV